jgi:hypothetical protein
MHDAFVRDLALDRGCESIRGGSATVLSQFPEDAEIETIIRYVEAGRIGKEVGSGS